MAWAFATVQQPDEKLSISLARAAERRASEFSSQMFANTTWAFAAIWPSDEQLFRWITKTMQLNNQKMFWLFSFVLVEKCFGCSVSFRFKKFLVAQFRFVSFNICRPAACGPWRKRRRLGSCGAVRLACGMLRRAPSSHGAARVCTCKYACIDTHTRNIYTHAQ